MGAPNIKIYQLPQGYTEDADNDIQNQAGDEVVPVVPKLAQLSDVNTSTPLVGAIIVNQQPLQCFNYNGGTHTVENLVPHPTRTGVYIPQTTSWSNVLWQPIGALAPVVKDSSSNVMATTTYTLTADGVAFTGSTVGATVAFYKTAAIGTQNTFAFAGDTFYAGANPTFNRLLVSKDGAEYAVTTPPATGVGYITVTSVTTSLKASYAVTTSLAKDFISPNPNWVGGHTNMWPDVFVGVYQYPGDSYTDGSGTPITPGPMPKFQDPGTYAVNFRDGSVSFPTAVNSSANPVRANYAYLTNVGNVTYQKLDAVTGSSNLRYSAQSEVLFPGSHGKRWVNRDNTYVPINVYVGGVLTPVPTSVVPYDTLDVKLS